MKSDLTSGTLNPAPPWLTSTAPVLAAAVSVAAISEAQPQEATVSSSSSAATRPAEEARSIPSTTGITEVATRAGIVAEPGVRLRERPTTDASVLETLPAGSEVKLMPGAADGDGFHWIQVQVSGSMNGWMVADGLQ